MANIEEAATHQVQNINLETFESFREHPWTSSVIQRYNKDAILARHALKRILTDLYELDDLYRKQHRRATFTTVEGRVKESDSFLRKLYKLCLLHVKSKGISGLTSLNKLYTNIHDLCGVRFACPYYDEVKFSINQLIRPRLSALGYATFLPGHDFEDKDYLDEGDEFGYRAYHFFVKIPTSVNIYGKVEMCLCEVQARSELQNVWAVKSHDLLYKPYKKWDNSDFHIVEEMRQLSNNLRMADQFLVSIRDRVRGVDSDVF